MLNFYLAVVFNLSQFQTQHDKISAMDFSFGVPPQDFPSTPFKK